MNKKDLTELRRLVGKLYREWKKHACEEYCFMCFQCEVPMAIMRFKSLITDRLEDDVAVDKWFKGLTKAKK